MQENPIAAKKKKKNRLRAKGLMLTKIILCYDFYKQRPCHPAGWATAQSMQKRAKNACLFRLGPASGNTFSKAALGPSKRAL